jgi:hypothetical protein
MKRFLCTVLLTLLTAQPGRAYPPAPAFTVFGTIRDSFGWEISSSTAEVLFREAGSGKVISKGPVTPGTLTENYRLLLPLDHNRAGLLYREEAVNTLAAFTIEVVIDGVTWFPVQASASPVTTLQSADFTRVDLVLSEDSDGDQLPDVWEQWQLEAGGLDPLRLDLIDPDGDPDGDGLSNYSEYVAGTFALLTSDTFHLEFTGFASDGWSEFRFLAIIGKRYFLERSKDLVLWERAPMSVGTVRGRPREDWLAPDTFFQNIASPPDGSGRWFYRLTVY